MKIVDNKLIQDEGDTIKVREFSTPNVINTSQISRKTLVIHAPEGRSLVGANAVFMNPPTPKSGIRRSVHIAIDVDGKAVEQFVPFNKVANHAIGHSSRSLGIELVYVGRLRKVERNPGFHLIKWFKEKFLGNQFLYASALNDSHFHFWPIFPKAQLDTLYKIAKIIKEKYDITDVLGYEELNSVLHPGPAFPIMQFREKLFGVTDRSIVLQDTTTDVMLLGEPGKDQSLLTDITVSKGASVTIINETTVPKKGRWYLISVINRKEESPWLIGWVEAGSVKVKTEFHAVVNTQHYITTNEGRRFKEIEPHPNGYDAKRVLTDPKYIIMHFTTGTKMESTISHFKNPSAGVSTHLLIGRDGRVVQFLPFDKVAHHTGFSWWEQESNLNISSIGIELDNAGLLKKRDGSKWFQRKVEIPIEDVKRAVHWKQYIPNDKENISGWEIFPQVQLDVALNVVRAIKNRYPSIVEVLGHDDVNLRNRYDPGPLFPMQDFREALFGRRDPFIQIHEINQDTELYGNFRGRLPNTSQNIKENLPAKSQVRIIIEEDDFSLVALIKSKNKKLKGIGWIQTASMEPINNGKANDKRMTRIPQPVYKQGEGAPTPMLWQGPFKKGTKVRIQQVRGAWTLVVVLVSAKEREETGIPGGLEGWMPSEFITPVIDQ